MTQEQILDIHRPHIRVPFAKPSPPLSGEVETTMRLGIISDIHGDWDSLRTAIGVLQNAAVNVLLCAGDLVERGSDDHGVVQLLREHSIPCVQGNHDENAVRHAALNADSDAPDDTVLSMDAIDFLSQLPLTQTFTFRETNILLAHATPSDNGAPVFQDSSCASLSKKFKKDLARMEADILIVGHTHFSFDIRFKSKRVLNPGSVCNLQSRDSHTCGILDLSDQSFSVLDLTTGSSIEVLVREFD